MKLSQKALASLIKRFKELADKDEMGITVTDAKMTVAGWLYDQNLFTEGDQFQDVITEYVLSKDDEPYER